MPLLIAFTLALAAPPTASDFTPATCEDPARRAALLADNAEEPFFLTEMKRLSEERERRTEELIERLSARAKLTDQQRAEFALGLLAAPGLEAEMMQGFAILENMMTLSETAENRDERGSCLVVVEMFGKLPAIQASADRQWVILERAIRAEAARRGVSLEP